MLQGLKSLFVAEMGPLPLGLLVPFSQLKSLNLSGNHLSNVLLQILNPVSKLEVCIICVYFYIHYFITLYYIVDLSCIHELGKG